MRLNHVSLSVSDVDRSAAFYGEHFGFTDRVHDDAHLLILANDSGDLLALSDADEPPTPLPRTNHFGVVVDTGADVLAARERFAAAGLEETEFDEGGHGAPARVQVADPDGYRVEVYAY